MRSRTRRVFTRSVRAALAALVLRMLTKLALKVWWTGISSKGCSGTESADESSVESSPGTTASTQTGGGGQYILDSPIGRIVVESSRFVPEGRVYVMDLAAAYGDLYNEKLHGPSRKVVVHDAEAFLETIKRDPSLTSRVVFGVATQFN